MAYYFDLVQGLKTQKQLELDQISAFVFLSQSQEITKNKVHRQKLLVDLVDLVDLAVLVGLAGYRI